jgi:hypothetical protein
MILSGHYDILYKQEDVSVPMSISAPTGNNEILVALNHAQTEHYHANLPFAVNDFEIPGMAIFPPSAMSGPMEMRQYGQYDYPQASLLPMSSMSGPARSYPAATTSFATMPATTIHQDMFRPINIPAEPQPPPAVTPISGLPSPLSSLPHHNVSLQSATPFRRSKWEVENFASLNGTIAPFCQTSIFKKYVL